MIKKTFLTLLMFSLIFSMPTAGQAAFSDVKNGHLNLEAINYVQSKGIVEGYDDKTYKPDNTINRAEFTKILIEAQFEPSVIKDCNTSVFSDVKISDWFNNYICVAQANGIVEGYDDKTYKPDQFISFAEAAKILVNAFQFSVEPSDIWYQSFVEKLAEKKAIPENITTFEKKITRGEMAEMIYRLKEKITNKPSKSLAMISNEILVVKSNRKISITKEVKHSVPLDEILAGGPPKDGIPSIDNPLFVTIKEADEFLEDDGLGIAISFNGIDRFYANQILVWHEIVNDQLGDQPVLITYCPLCGTGIVYEPIVNHEITEFGTSGKLWNSNLVMYDRQTNSYWSQVLGEAIVGEMTGVKLKLLPYSNMLYKDWKRDHPKGEVLSKKTGYIRDYNRDPYGDYYSNREVFFPVDHESDEFHPKEIIFGIELNNEYKAYPLTELKKIKKTFDDELAGVKLKVSFNNKNNTIDIRQADSNAEVIPSYGFWFSWFSVHPETKVYRSK